MRGRLLFTVFLLLAATGLRAQSGRQTGLSKQFDVAVRLQAPGARAERRIAILVFDKGKTIARQQWSVTPAVLFETAFTNRAGARSYSTGYGSGREAVDGDYGDVVVADLNFDGRDDLAVKRDEGGPSGPYYAYFLQEKNGRFQPAPFLTDSVRVFPFRMNARRRELTTFRMRGYCGAAHYRYRWGRDGTCRFVRRETFGHCRD